ncbi:MAG: BMP family ABC transporter substrate-binding protein [Niameybacter sp.]
MKKTFTLLLSVAMILGATGCSSEITATEGVGDQAIKVGIVLSTGGLGDKNFNDMAYEGLLKAQEDFGIEFDYVEPKSASDFEPNHRMFAETEEYDLIIGLAADQKEAITAVAEDFPEQKISYIDADLDHPTVRTICTIWPEQTFLTGVIAGLATQSSVEGTNGDNVVGVILGMDNPNLRTGLVGFEAGVKYVNPTAEVLQATVGAFNDPGKAKEIALSMYNRGADFIQPIAGASGLGVFNAAKEVGAYAFGVGGNQNTNEPDHIVATAVRNVNEMIYNEVKMVVEDTWEPGLVISGLKEEAVGYSVEGSNVVLPQEMIDIVEEIKVKIINGEVVPCGNADELEEWVKNNQYTAQ